MAAAKITDKTWKKLDDAVSTATAQAFTDAKSGTDIHKLGVALSLLAMLDTSLMGKEGDQTLDQYDSEARGVLAMRRAAVERGRDEWAKSATVRDGLLKAREDGIKQVLGVNWLARVEAHGEYLASDAFLDPMMKLGDKKRAQIFKAEILKITALDPDIGQTVACEWMAYELKHDPLKVIQNTSEPEAVEALEDLLALIAKMTESEAAIEDAQPAGTQGATIVPGHAIHKLLATSVARRSIARGLTGAVRSRSYYGALDGNNDLQLIQKLKANNVPGAELLEKLTKAGFVGRGITSFFSLWGLSAVAAGFPPIDEAGNVRWKQLAVSASAGLAIVGNIPDIAKFFSADVGAFLSKTILADYGTKLAGTAVGSGANSAGKMARAAKFAKICAFLGAVGDAIALPLAVIAVRDEWKNEDAVGTFTSIVGVASGAAGLVGGIMLFAGGSASTGIGLPLAVVAALAGIAAALIDAAFGESALTGQIRQDLRYLDISTEEESSTRDLTTDTRQVTRRMRGVTFTQRQRYALSQNQIRTRAKTANQYEKIALLNQYFEGYTSGNDEKLIYLVLCDAPYENNHFLSVVEGTDARRVASELEDAGQASSVMVWTARAYELDGKPPGRAFNEQFLYHCKEHRDDTLNAFFKKVIEKAGDGNTLQRSIYYKVSPSVLIEGTKSLMSGATSGGEEQAIFRTLAKTSWSQFGEVMSKGGTSYVRQLKSELGRGQWRDVHKWLQEPKAGASANHLARVVRR